MSGYAAAAGAMIALTPSANAQVIWSDIQDTVVHLNDTLLLDINSDGNTDFKFLVNGSDSFRGSTYNSSRSYRKYFYRYASAYVMNPNTFSNKNSWVAHSWSSGYGRPFGLNAGDIVDNNRSYWNHDTYKTYYGRLGKGSAFYFKSYYSHHAYGTYNRDDFAGVDKFLGVKFYINGQQHYGWVRANLSIGVQALTLKDWAYETQPDSGVIAGGVPPVFLNDKLYNTDTVEVGLNFPFPVQNLAKGDFIISNGAVSDVIEDVPGLNYRIQLVRDSDGEVNLTLPMDSVDNTEGLVVLAQSTKFFVDTKAPVAIIDAGLTTTSNKKVTVSVIFDEKIKGLSSGDFVITNGTASNLKTVSDSLKFTVDVTADAAGEVTIKLPQAAVTDLAGNGNGQATNSYAYIPPVAIDGITDENILLYPNPAHSTLHIKLSSEAMLSIIDVSGETIYMNEHFYDEDVDLSNYKAGIYFVQIQQNGQIVHKKLIIE